MPKGSFSFSWQNSFRCLKKTPWTNSEIQNIVFKCVLCLADVYNDYFGVTVWLMSGSGKDNRWNLTIPPWCVFVCVSVSFLHFSFFFFGKISTGQGTYCTLFSLTRLCLAQHKKKLIPLTPPYLTFLCPLLTAPCSEEMNCSPQCQRKAQAAHLNSPKLKQNGWTQTIDFELWQKRDAKCLPVT